MAENRQREHQARQPQGSSQPQPPEHETERERQNREFWRALHEAERQGVPEVGTVNPGGPRRSAPEQAPSPELQEQERGQAHSAPEAGAE
ncbi:MAG TPA: hypothetical protein VFU88_06190 [Ktedonobacterales bacterium]|nr:hypothetical protein [Ktedonobacterales bacterium]